ncbi:hypothetical protein HELRODRAFT_194842 [Helobdella robusta]|uniref:Ig-like domain-containing protein n=1 Tax=Helobdella robusta TaxID=6412 RepID=T1FWH2_HELRO|nr:hypothetical protein HELRODRAFT_194842 [Helobdella robusta]ESO11335.1 hypothetical protein HELRODRAFT_194842 [Helobdella robusta]
MQKSSSETTSSRMTTTLSLLVVFVVVSAVMGSTIADQSKNTEKIAILEGSNYELICNYSHRRPSILFWSETVTAQSQGKSQIGSVNFKDNSVLPYPDYTFKNVKINRATFSLMITNISQTQGGEYYCSDTDIDNVISKFDINVCGGIIFEVPNELEEKKDYKIKCKVSCTGLTTLKMYIVLGGEQVLLQQSTLSNEDVYDYFGGEINYQASGEDDGKEIQCISSLPIVNYDKKLATRKLSVKYAPNKLSIQPEVTDLRETDEKILCTSNGNPKQSVSLVVHGHQATSQTPLGTASVNVADLPFNETVTASCEVKPAGGLPSIKTSKTFRTRPAPAKQKALESSGNCNILIQSILNHTSNNPQPYIQRSLTMHPTLLNHASNNPQPYIQQYSSASNNTNLDYTVH